MWIEINSDHVQSLGREWMDAEDRPVTFNDENRARVPADVGERLADEVGGVTVVSEE